LDNLFKIPPLHPKINFVYLSKLKSKVMTQFEENHPEQLKLFLNKLNELVDEFHPNIYLLDGVFKGIQTIEIAILDELNRDK
jgi:hypothetical protein